MAVVADGGGGGGGDGDDDAGERGTRPLYFCLETRAHAEVAEAPAESEGRWVKWASSAGSRQTDSGPPPAPRSQTEACMGTVTRGARAPSCTTSPAWSP